VAGYAKRGYYLYRCHYQKILLNVFREAVSMIGNIYRILFNRVFLKLRILHYRLISRIKIEGDKPVLSQPLFTIGLGKIKVGKGIVIGVYNSPFSLTGYCYLECRSKEATIYIGDGTRCNNNFSVICDKSGVYIGKEARIGLNVCIMDSDFHNVDAAERDTGTHDAARVEIGDHVFIGNNVTILKGVKIGNNSVIANGSIVSSSIPDNCIAGGVPAKVIKNL
jgi:maltose O-acetyltransferase